MNWAWKHYVKRKIQEINNRVIQYQNQADCLHGRVWKMVKYKAMGRQMGKIDLKKVWRQREQEGEKLEIWRQKFLVGNLPLNIILVMELLSAPTIWHYGRFLMWICWHTQFHYCVHDRGDSLDWWFMAWTEEVWAPV